MRIITRTQLQQALNLVMSLAFDVSEERRDDRYDDGRLTPSHIGRAPGVVVELLGAPEALHFITLGIALIPEQPAQFALAMALAGPLLAVAWPGEPQLVLWYIEQMQRTLLSPAETSTATHPTRPIKLACDKQRRQMLLHIGLWDDDRR